MERKCPKCGSLHAYIGMSTSTCMGWSPYYDENGNYVSNDPNIHTTEYTCGKCGTRYSVSTQLGKSKINIISEPAKEPEKSETITIGGDLTASITSTATTTLSGMVTTGTLYFNNKSVISTIKENIEVWAKESGLEKTDAHKQMIKLVDEIFLKEEDLK